MKKTTLFLAILFLAFPLIAQEYQHNEEEDDFKTIFHRNNGDIFISGFGAPIMQFTQIDGKFAHMMGGGGGVILSNFFFGGYGMGLTTNLDYKGIISDTLQNYTLDYGHGGFWVGYTIAPKLPIHLSVSSQFGWGGISKQSEKILDPRDRDDDFTSVFVVTPVVEIEMNFSHFFKVGIGGSMSFVNGLSASNSLYTQRDFANPSVFLSFKFGYFE